MSFVEWLKSQMLKPAAEKQLPFVPKPPPAAGWEKDKSGGAPALVTPEELAAMAREIREAGMRCEIVELRPADLTPGRPGECDCFSCRMDRAVRRALAARN